MKKVYNVFAIAASCLLLQAALTTGCKKNDGGELGQLPQTSFTVTPVASKVNTYLVTSTTTPSAFAYKWDMGDGNGVRDGKQVDTAYYPEKGTFTIKLTVLAKGGYATATQTVTVANDDPNGCVGKKALLTNCTSKTWVLDQPGGGALFVGDVNGGQWWSNSASDVNAADRTCLFNDEYTFKKDGSFIFDDKGDIRVDDESGAPWPAAMGPAIGCYSIAQIPAPYKPWGSGNHTFKIVGNQLQVIGLGAHLGLYKAGQNGTIDMPETSNTYNILELTATKLVVQKMYSWGQWKFTLKAK